MIEDKDKIEQYWKINIENENPTFPFVVIDNWYTPNEEKAVWKELDFFSCAPKDKTHRAENTVVAKDDDGESLSKAYRYYIEDFYNKRIVSPILNCMYKQRTEEFKKILTDNCMPYARSFLSSNKDCSLLSYYEENDHYKPHFDSFQWTCLIWMVKDRDLFKGGDFWFPESDIEIKLKNNRMIIFPSCFMHAVNPIKFQKKPQGGNLGKYTITHFYYTTPQGTFDDIK